MARKATKPAEDDTPAGGDKADKDVLKDALEDFKCCDENETEMRLAFTADMKFVKLNEQWDEQAKNARGANRPTLTINKLGTFTKQVTNDARMNRPSINIKPLGDGATKDVARIQSDLIRNIETQSKASIVYDTATEFAVCGGYGYFRVDVDYAHDAAWDQDIVLRRVSNPLSIYGDWESTSASSDDWMRAFVADWYPLALFKRKWKGAAACGFTGAGKDWREEWFGAKGVRVAEYWTREEVDAKLLKLSNGSIMYEPEFEKVKDLLLAQRISVKGTRDTKTFKVTQRLITGTDVLETNKWAGKYIPIIPMYGEEVCIDGKRYFKSLIRDAKDMQRVFNYEVSIAVEMSGLAPKAPYIGPKGAFRSDQQKWQSSNSVPYPFMEYDVVKDTPDGGRPQRQQFDGTANGALELAAMADQNIKATLGMFDASIGNRSNETSGVAITARKREGDTATFHFIDNRDRAVEHGGCVVLDLIPHYYGVERILLCVQEDGESYTVPVNQPVVARQHMDEMMRPQQAPMPQPGMPGMQQQPGAMGPGPLPMGAPPAGGMPHQQPGAAMPQGPGAPGATASEGPPEWVAAPDPQTMSPEMQAKLKAVTKIFDLTTGKYGVMVTKGPSFNTRREEAASQMMEFIRIFPQAAGIIGDLLAKNLDWPGAEQVAARLKAMLPPQAHGQVDPFVQQLQQQLQSQDQQARAALAELQDLVKQLTYKIEDKTTENKIKAYDADTKRIGQLVDAHKEGLVVQEMPQGGFMVRYSLPGMPPEAEIGYGPNGMPQGPGMAPGGIGIGAPAGPAFGRQPAPGQP